jgi:hypothetical protein
MEVEHHRCRLEARAGATPDAARSVASDDKEHSAQYTHGRRDPQAPWRADRVANGTRATLRGKALKISGRTITADLTGRPEGNYNVRLTSRYRAHSGKVVTIKTTRNLSVVCS